MTVEMMESLLSFYGGVFRKKDSKRIKRMHYGKTFEGRTLDVYRIRPYMKHHNLSRSKLAPVPVRPAIWVEAGFEGANIVGVQIALSVMEYLNDSCPNPELPICTYDYYILPDVNVDGLHMTENLAKQGNQKPWNKTKEPFSEPAEDCTGVYLLNNFDHGNFEAGSNNKCSGRYRGPYPMSAEETLYQQAIKSQTSPVLSITISEMGSKITAPYAHTKMEHPCKERYRALMDVFTAKTTNYTSGFYAEEHDTDYGHPLDYNDYVYNGNSFNVALEEGTVDANNKYVHSNDSVARMIKDFCDGFFHLAQYVVENDYKTSACELRH